jgi:hypothetical protein
MAFLAVAGVRVAPLSRRHTLREVNRFECRRGRRFAVSRVAERNDSVLRKAISAARSSSDKSSPN